MKERKKPTHEFVPHPRGPDIASSLRLAGEGPVGTYPLATPTTAAIAAAAATGTGGAGGSNTYQTFYNLIFTLTTNATAAQNGAVAITEAIALDYAPVFAALSAQDQQIADLANAHLGVAQTPKA